MRAGDADTLRGVRCPHRMSACTVRIGRRLTIDFGLWPAPPNHHQPRLRAAPLTPLGRGFAGVGGLDARLLISSFPFAQALQRPCRTRGHPRPLRARATPFSVRCRSRKGTPSRCSCVGRAAATTCFNFASQSLAPQAKLAALILLAFLLTQKVEKMGCPRAKTRWGGGASRPPQQKIAPWGAQPLGGLFLSRLPPKHSR